MRPMTIVRALAAGLLVGGLSAAALPVASAAPAGNFTVLCQTSNYPVFDWNVAVDATAELTGPATTLTLQLSDLPGVAPVPMRDLGMTATIEAEVNGSPLTLSGQGFVSFEADTPFAIPSATGTIVGQPTQLDIVIRSMSYNIPSFEMDTVCPPGGGSTEIRLAPVQVSGHAPVATTEPVPAQAEAPKKKRAVSTSKPAQADAATDGTSDAGDDEAAGVQSAGLGGALPLVGGSALVLAVLGWFVFFRKPSARGRRA